MVKTKHKLLDFSPSYLESVDKIFHIWGWKEFCFPLAVIWIGGSFLLCTFVQTIRSLVSQYFDIEIATTNSITWHWHWVTLGFVIIVVVYYLVLMLLICIQLHKIKDFDDIPFRSAQTLFSWKSSRSFVLAIHQNRPDFNQNKFNDFWSTKKESAIAN